MKFLQTFIYWCQVVDEGLEVVLSGWRGEGNKTVVADKVPLLSLQPAGKS